MHADYLKIKSAFLEHASGLDYYNKNKRTISGGSKAGMPSSVPSYYRGTGNVSVSSVNDQTKYKAYQDYKKKYSEYSLQLANKKAELIKAKEAKKLADQIPTIEKDVDNLTKLADRYKTLMENTQNSQSKADVDKQKATENKIKEAGRFMSKSFVSGNGNIVKGMATTLVEENTPIKNNTYGFTMARSRQGNNVSNFYFGKKKNKRY